MARKKDSAPERRDPADQIIYDQGRTARASSIGRDDSPHADGPAKDLWLEGWDFENAQREGGRG